jgi:hypothetical protein
MWRAAGERPAGAILRDRDGRVLNTLALDIPDGQIQTIRTVRQARLAQA